MIMMRLFLELLMSILGRGLYLLNLLKERLPTRQHLTEIRIFFLVELLLDQGKAVSMVQDHLINFVNVRFLGVILLDLISVELVQQDSLTDILCAIRSLALSLTLSYLTLSLVYLLKICLQKLTLLRVNCLGR